MVGFVAGFFRRLRVFLLRFSSFAGFTAVAGFVVSALSFVVLVAMLAGAVTFLSPPAVEASETPGHCYTEFAKSFKDPDDPDSEEGYCRVNDLLVECSEIQGDSPVCSTDPLPVTKLTCVNFTISELNEKTTCAVDHGIVLECLLVNETLTGNCSPAQDSTEIVLNRPFDDEFYWEHNCTIAAVGTAEKWSDEYEEMMPVKRDALCLHPETGLGHECQIYLDDTGREKDPVCKNRIYLNANHTAAKKWGACEVIGSHAAECDFGKHTTICFNTDALEQPFNITYYAGCTPARDNGEFLNETEARVVIAGGYANTTIALPDKPCSVLTLFGKPGEPATNSTNDPSWTPQHVEAAGLFLETLNNNYGPFNSASFEPQPSSTSLVPLVDLSCRTLTLTAGALIGAGELFYQLEGYIGELSAATITAGTAITLLAGVSAVQAYRWHTTPIPTAEAELLGLPLTQAVRSSYYYMITWMDRIMTPELINEVSSFRAVRNSLDDFLETESIDSAHALTDTLKQIPREARITLADVLGTEMMLNGAVITQEMFQDLWLMFGKIIPEEYRIDNP